MNFKQKKLFPILFLSLLLGVFSAYSYLMKAVSEPAITEASLPVAIQKVAYVPAKSSSTSHHIASRPQRHLVAAHQEAPVITQPVAQVDTTPTPIVADKSGEFEAGLGSNKIDEPSLDMQIGVRVGAIAPNLGLIFDLTAFPFRVSDRNLVTRFSLGAVQNDTNWTAVLYVNELIVLGTDNPNLSYYAGAGLNLPLNDNGGIGYNILMGIDHKMSLFGLKDESMFVETGLNTYATTRESASTHLNLLGGYKFTF